MIQNKELERNATGLDFVDDNINTYNKNKFLVRFSNFPNFTGHKLNMNVINLNVESITIPDISIPMLSSDYLHEHQLHPASIGKRELQTVIMTLQCDEKQINYHAFYKWIWFMRHGMTCGKTNLEGEELLRMDCIDAIDVIHYNNKGVPVSITKFIHCILDNLSSIELTKQQSDICKFNVTFKCEGVDLDILTNEE